MSLEFGAIVGKIIARRRSCEGPPAIRLALRRYPNRCADPGAPTPLRQLVVAVTETLEAHRKSDALLGGLKDDEGRRRAGPQLLDQGSVHDHLGDATARQTAHE